MKLADEQKIKLKELTEIAKRQGDIHSEAMAALTKYIAFLNVEANDLKEPYAEIRRQNPSWDWVNNNVLIWLSVFVDLPEFYKKIPRIFSKLNMAPAVGPYRGASLLWLMMFRSIIKSELSYWEKIKTLLKQAEPKSINLNAFMKNSEDRVPLWYLTVITGQVDIVNLLLEKADANIDFNVKTTAETCLCQMLKMAGKISEDALRNPDDRAISERAESSFKMIEILLENALPKSIDLKVIDADKKTLLWLAFNEMPPKIIALLIEKSKGSIDVDDPVWTYNEKSLLAASISKTECHPLEWFYPKIKQLFDLGANPKTDISLKNMGDYQGVIDCYNLFRSVKSATQGTVYFWKNQPILLNQGWSPDLAGPAEIPVLD